MTLSQDNLWKEVVRSLREAVLCSIAEGRWMEVVQEVLVVD